MTLSKGIVNGAMAGAAGTTALNAVAYLDMVMRGRGASSAPEDTVEKLSRLLSLPVPGRRKSRPNRISGLGALTGILSGVGVGAALGALQAAKANLGTRASVIVGAAAAMILTDGTMTGLGVTDPRQWSAVDWASDIVPHLAYGIVTTRTLRSMS